MEWISVEDELPEDCESVLVYCRHGYQDTVHVAFCDIDENEWYIQLEYPPGFYKNERPHIANLNYVTHWMPLPEFPE